MVTFSDAPKVSSTSFGDIYRACARKVIYLFVLVQTLRVGGVLNGNAL